MGLNGPKKRSKISGDPNNNNWSRSTDRFGHRILISQGWTPGSTLGARDAAHAAHFTAASASHVRVLLKDDNLGLGATRAGAGGLKADSFGLSALQGLLGRLNGKSEEKLRKEEGAMRDVQLARYQGQRWGNVNFVSGGFLVGETIERKKTAAGDAKKSKEVGDEVDVAAIPATGSSTKRKRGDDTQAVNEGTVAAKKPKKKRKEDEVAEASRTKLSKEGEAVEPSSDEAESEQMTDSRHEKAEKRHRKEERRRRRAEKQARRDAKVLRTAQTAARDTKKAPSTSTPPARASMEKEERPNSVAVKTVVPSAPFGRHAVRQRYIRSKQMASADPRALKEIFMIKT